MRCLILPLLLLVSQAYAHRGSTFSFATLPPSPMANGRAGIFLGPEETDPLVAWSNPGLLGLMAQTQQASATMYTERSRWLPGLDIDDLTFSARGVFASWPSRARDAKSSWLPIGIAYTERYLNLGEVRRTDPSGMLYGESYHSYERVNSLHFGIAQHSTLWRFGAGTGLNYAYSRLGSVSDGTTIREAAAHGVSADLGLWLDNDGAESMRRLFKIDASDNLILRPMIGLAVTNIGPGVSYDDRLSDAPQPRTARITMGLAAGIQIQHADGLPWRLCMFNIAAEADDELVKRDNSSDYSYQLPPGDINLLTDILLGQRNESIHQKKAFEVSIFEMLFIRGGSELFEGDDMFKVESTGWGISLHGVMRLAAHASESNKIAWFARHIDLQYHESRESVDGDEYGDNPRDGTKYQGIVLSYLR